MVDFPVSSQDHLIGAEGAIILLWSMMKPTRSAFDQQEVARRFVLIGRLWSKNAVSTCEE